MSTRFRSSGESGGPAKGVVYPPKSPCRLARTVVGGTGEQPIHCHSGASRMERYRESDRLAVLLPSLPPAECLCTFSN
jgi:hypothetical protein